MPAQGIITNSSQLFFTTSEIPCSSFPKIIRTGYPDFAIPQEVLTGFLASKAVPTRRFKSNNITV